MRGRLARIAAATCVLAVALTGCGFHGVYDLPLPGGADLGPRPYTVVADFTDVLDLVPQSAVKVGDVTVGKVDRIELEGWHARVYCEVQGKVRLPDNARASVRQTSLLGEKYVQLERPAGTAEGRLGDGDMIPLSRTQQSAEVEQVLALLAALLNGGGLPQLRTINKELNAALSGREDLVRDVIDRLETFLGSLDEQKDDIDRAIENVDALAGSLRAQRSTIDKTLDRVPPALKVLNDQRRALVRLLQALARLGDVGTRVIHESRADLLANLRALQPILDRLADAGSDLPQALGIALTYPFPTNSGTAVQGDYTNLHLTVDLDLAQILQVVGRGGPTSGNLPRLSDLLKLAQPDLHSQQGEQGPSVADLLPQGLIPRPGETGAGGATGPGKGGNGAGGSGQGSGDDGDLLGLLLGGLL